MRKTGTRIGSSREGRGASRKVAKIVGMRIVRRSSSSGEKWEGIDREWTGNE